MEGDYVLQLRNEINMCETRVIAARDVLSGYVALYQRKRAFPEDVRDLSRTHRKSISSEMNLMAEKEKLIAITLKKISTNDVTYPIPKDRMYIPMPDKIRKELDQCGTTERPATGFFHFYTKMLEYGEKKDFSHKTYLEVLGNRLEGDIYQDFILYRDSGNSFNEIIRKLMLSYGKGSNVNDYHTELLAFRRKVGEKIEPALLRFQALLERTRILYPEDGADGRISEECKSAISQMCSHSCKKLLKEEYMRMKTNGITPKYEVLLHLASNYEQNTQSMPTVEMPVRLLNQNVENSQTFIEVQAAIMGGDHREHSPGLAKDLHGTKRLHESHKSSDNDTAKNIDNAFMKLQQEALAKQQWQQQQQQQWQAQQQQQWQSQLQQQQWQPQQQQPMQWQPQQQQQRDSRSRFRRGTRRQNLQGNHQGHMQPQQTSNYAPPPFPGSHHGQSGEPMGKLSRSPSPSAASYGNRSPSPNAKPLPALLAPGQPQVPVPGTEQANTNWNFKPLPQLTYENNAGPPPPPPQNNQVWSGQGYGQYPRRGRGGRGRYQRGGYGGQRGGHNNHFYPNYDNQGAQQHQTAPADPSTMAIRGGQGQVQGGQYQPRGNSNQPRGNYNQPRGNYGGNNYPPQRPTTNNAENVMFLNTQGNLENNITVNHGPPANSDQNPWYCPHCQSTERHHRYRCMLDQQRRHSYDVNRSYWDEYNKHYQQPNNIQTVNPQTNAQANLNCLALPSHWQGRTN